MNKTLILVIAAIILIMCLVFGFSNTDTNTLNIVEDNETSVELKYKESVDEMTGEKYYQIYNEETGKVVKNVVDESLLKMYIDNPDYTGPENDIQQGMENIIK